MPSSALPGHTVVLFLVCSGTSILFSIVAVSAYFPTNSAECSLLSASSPALTVCTFSNGDHSDICEVTAHWHVDPVGEGEGWTNWGVRIDMYTLHVQNRKLIGTCREHRHLSLQLCDALEGWDGGWGGREAQQGGDICIHIAIHWASFPCGSAVKDPPANAGDAGLIPGLGRFLGEGNNSVQYSCLENPMDRRAWWATVHGVAQSQTRLRDWTTTKPIHFFI